jgi:K+ transporter
VIVAVAAVATARAAVAMVVTGAVAIWITGTEAALLADAGLGHCRDNRRKRHALQPHYHGEH